MEHDEASRGAHLEALLDSVKLNKITPECLKYALGLPAVSKQLPALLKLSVGFASRTKGAYSPADAATRATKRPRTS